MRAFQPLADSESTNSSLQLHRLAAPAAMPSLRYHLSLTDQHTKHQAQAATSSRFQPRSTRTLAPGTLATLATLATSTRLHSPQLLLLLPLLLPPPSPLLLLQPSQPPQRLHVSQLLRQVGRHRTALEVEQPASDLYVVVCEAPGGPLKAHINPAPGQLLQPPQHARHPLRAQAALVVLRRLPVLRASLGPGL
jgi:hypothetical protein